MGSRILIIDDNPANMRLTSNVLGAEGYDVYGALDADSALALIPECAPELILMDLALPGLDGLSLTRKLKADPATRHIPVVALTASAMKGDDKKALDAGCVGYVIKPIDTRAFPGMVAEFLKKGGVGG